MISINNTMIVDKEDNIEYRKAQYKDVYGIAQLVSNLLGTCSLNLNKSIIDNNIDEISKTIENYYVCEYNNKIIGACGISDIKKNDNYGFNLKNIKEILYLVVDKQYQRRGIGTKLLNLCVDNQENDILYEAWGDNGEYVNSKYILEKCGFKLYKDLGKDYYRNHGYCSLCVNNDKKCKTCLAQIWLKRK